MVGGGALALTTNPSALAAMEAAKKAAAGLGLAGANTGVPAEPDHFQEELEINDYPQHARWKATHRDRFVRVPPVLVCSIACACVFGSVHACMHVYTSMRVSCMYASKRKGGKGAKKC